MKPLANRLVLGGVAMSAVLSGVSQFLSLLDPDTFVAVRNWAVGSIGRTRIAELLPVLPLVGVALMLAFALGRSLDAMALGARAALQETGRRVPHDVSLVGFDNSQLAQSRFLSLTTVDNHAFDAGIACAEALLRRFAAPDAPPRHVVLATSLVARSSSARAAGHTGRTAG